MTRRQRFEQHVRDIFAEFDLPGQRIESVTFTRRARRDLARITFGPDGTCKGKPFTMLIGLWRARTKYEVLRELVETGFTHCRYDRAYAQAWIADFRHRGLYP